MMLNQIFNKKRQEGKNTSPAKSIDEALGEVLSPLTKTGDQVIIRTYGDGWHVGLYTNQGKLITSVATCTIQEAVDELVKKKATFLKPA